MPNGQTHNLINTLAYGALGTFAYYGVQNNMLDVSWSQAIAFSGAYWVGTLLLSPDLDLHKNNSRRNWGILGFIWTPYSILFAHRGWSHTWIVGPLTRLAYLTLLLLIPYFVAQYFIPEFKLHIWGGLLPNQLDFWLPYIAGYYLSQWMHLIADGIRPDHDFKRLTRR